MVVTLVTFPLTEPISAESATQLFARTSDAFRGMPGLLSKHYIRSDGGFSVGALYFWSTRSAAQALYGRDWRARILAVYGTEPRVEWFTNVLTIDNIAPAS